jgi:hypothetical protein
VSNKIRSVWSWTLGILLLAGASGAASVVDASDWPQFRGPDRDGISKERGLLTSWPVSGPVVSWRKKLGEGYSGISVVDGRLYTMFSEGNDDERARTRVFDGRSWTMPTLADGRLYLRDANEIVALEISE